MLDRGLGKHVRCGDLCDKQMNLARLGVLADVIDQLLQSSTQRVPNRLIDGFECLGRCLHSTQGLLEQTIVVCPLLFIASKSSLM